MCCVLLLLLLLLLLCSSFEFACCACTIPLIPCSGAVLLHAHQRAHPTQTAVAPPRLRRVPLPTTAAAAAATLPVLGSMAVAVVFQQCVLSEVQAAAQYPRVQTSASSTRTSAT